MIDSIKTPVVFFPGTLCDERIFIPLWQSLNSQGRSLDNKAFVPLQWADDLAQMLALSEDRLAYFPSKMHLVGYSMGGYIAALAALANPEKVASLTLVSNTAKGLAEDELQQRKVLLSAIKNKQYKGMTQARVDYMLHGQHQGSNEFARVIQKMADDLGPAVLAAQTKATAERQNLTGKLSQQPFMTHFVVGEQDNIATPNEVQSLAAKHSSDNNAFNIEVVSGAGHMLPLEQTEALASWMLHTLE